MRLKPSGKHAPPQLKAPQEGGTVAPPAPDAPRERPSGFTQGSAPKKSNPVESPSGSHIAGRGAALGYEVTDSKPQSTLAALREAGTLGLEMKLELKQHILGEGAVDTRDQVRAVPMIRSAADLRQLDAEMDRQVPGGGWAKLKTITNQWAGTLDEIANRERLAPEGIHPDFALAAKPLLKAAGGQEVPRYMLNIADLNLAALVSSSGDGSATTCEVWLRQFGIGPEQAPRTFAALSAKLGDLPDLGDTSNDSELSKLLATLPPQKLLRAQHLLALAGLVNDRLTFYGANATPQFAAQCPKCVDTLRSRDVRKELLSQHLAHDPEYQALKATRDELIEGTGLKPDEVEWALIQDQKLRFLETENAEGIASPGDDLSKRSIEKTFFDHLRARREGDLEKDLRLNYDPDVIFTSNQGNFFGHEGVRQSAANLAKLVPGREWVMNRLSFVHGKDDNEGYATEVWSAELPGRLVTAVDNFFIKAGKILMQSAYYTDVRPDLERKPV